MLSAPPGDQTSGSDGFAERARFSSKLADYAERYSLLCTVKRLRARLDASPMPFSFFRTSSDQLSVFLCVLLVPRRSNCNLEPGQNVSLWRLLDRDRPWRRMSDGQHIQHLMFEVQTQEVGICASLFDLRPGLGAVDAFWRLEMCAMTIPESLSMKQGTKETTLGTHTHTHTHTYTHHTQTHTRNQLRSLLCILYYNRSG